MRELIIGAADRADASASDEQRIGDLYASFLDEQTVQRRGLEPLLNELSLIDAAAGPGALAPVIGRFT